MAYQVIFEKTAGNLQGSLPTVIQGSTLETIAVLALYRDGSNVNLTGKTISGTATDNDGNTYTLSGTFVGANGSFTWEFSAGDVGTANTYAIVITYTDGVDEWGSDPVRFIVRPNPSATAVQNNALVGISTALSAWLSVSEAGGALGTAAYEDTTVFATATALTDHINDTSAAHDDSAIAAAASATNYTPAAASVQGHLSGIDTALGAVSSDVSDLTTAGLTSPNMLRIAAGGGLEERTPAQVLSDIGAEATGTAAQIANNALLVPPPYQQPVAADSFTGANGTLITARLMDTGAVWSVGIGSLDIQSNKAQETTADKTVGSVATFDQGWNNGTITFKFVQNTNGDHLGCVFRWTDSSNYWRVRFATAGGNDFRLYEVNAGVETLRVFSNPTLVLGTEYTFTATINGSSITAEIIGIASLSYTSTFNASATRHGIYHKRLAAGTPGTIDNFVAYAGSGGQPANALNKMLIVFPSPTQVFQREGGVADIPISGSFTPDGFAHVVEASFDGGAYTEIARSRSGVFYGVLENQPEGQGSLIVRLADLPAITATVANVGVGDIFMIAGQSNASGFGALNQTYSGAVVASTLANNYTWKALVDPVDSNAGQIDAVSNDITGGGDPGGSYWPILATAIAADQTGIPVAFVPCSMGSTAIISWLPGANRRDRATLYGSMLHRFETVGGKCKAVLFHQGESDATINGFTGGVTYQARMEALATAVLTDFNAPLVVARIHKWEGAPATTQPNVDEINAAMAAAAAANVNCILGPHFDSPTKVTTELHIRTNPELADAGARWWAALETIFY